LLPLIIHEAFVVAWGGTAAQAGRLAGLLILSLELKNFSVRRREAYVFWVLLLIILGKQTEDRHPVRSDLLSGLVFANNAVAVGTLRYVAPKFDSQMFDTPMKSRAAVGHFFMLS
jgi:hypothetical protein